MSFISRTWNFVFEKLFALSLREMNFGKTNNYHVNGELRSLQQLAERWKNTEVTLFDVGANVGEFTLEIIQAFEESKFKLYAFEPSSRAWAQLRHRVPESPNINVHQMALSNQEGTAELFFPEEGSTLSSLYQRDLRHTKWTFGKTEKVNVTTLDKFCEQNQISYIHLLKMDVEGHELSLLKGAQRMLESNSIEVIQFEFGGANIDSRTYFKDFYQLLGPKYKIYRILAHDLRELPKYTEKLEIFQSANYLAVRRS